MYPEKRDMNYITYVWLEDMTIRSHPAIHAVRLFYEQNDAKKVTFRFFLKFRFTHKMMHSEKLSSPALTSLVLNENWR